MAKKPNITDAPDWAEYTIKDDSGVWWWCENKPKIDADGFISHVGKIEEVYYVAEDDLKKPIKIK